MAIILTAWGVVCFTAGMYFGAALMTWVAHSTRAERISTGEGAP